MYIHFKFFKSVPDSIGLILGTHHAIINRIFTHPFNKGLFLGNLPVNNFKKYLVDDISYLNQCGIYLRKAARFHQCPILSDAAKMVGTELDMHERYGYLLNGTNSQSKNTSLFNYQSHLESHLMPPAYHHSQATSSISSNLHWLRSIAAILPCFWTYAQLPIFYQFKANEQQHNPYIFWIKTYQQPHFVAINKRMCEAFNQRFMILPKDKHSIINDIIRCGLQHELDFYDSAVNLSDHAPNHLRLPL